MMSARVLLMCCEIAQHIIIKMEYVAFAFTRIIFPQSAQVHIRNYVYFVCLNVRMCLIINPQRACTARVTVFAVSVCLSVCVSVCVSLCYHSRGVMAQLSAQTEV